MMFRAAQRILMAEKSRTLLSAFVRHSSSAASDSNQRFPHFILQLFFLLPVSLVPVKTYDFQAGWQGWRHHRRRKRHRQGHRRRVRQERCQGHPRRRPGRAGPRGGRGARPRRGLLHPLRRHQRVPGRRRRRPRRGAPRPPRRRLQQRALDLDNFDRVMAVNTRAVVAGVKHAARVMVPRRTGSIICTASAAGVLGGVAFPPYTVSKAAVIGLVRSVAGELARAGVRVNAISPHYIPTPLVMGAMATWYPATNADDLRRIVEREMNEMDGQVLEAEDVAKAALYLASDDAKYVNGHNLVVDGGFTVTKAPNMPAMAK